MDIKDITSENYEQFKYVFWLDRNGLEMARRLYCRVLKKNT